MLRPLCFALALAALPAAAQEPVIQKVLASQSDDGTWRFDVTILHPDEGWTHYADGWRVELEDGTVLGTRTLYHPHVEEQPFTRSLGGVVLPAGVTRVFIRAKCSVDGWSDERHALDLAG